ncbi:type VII secretion target [Amycolatopsis sp. NPDC004378]
MAGEGMKVDFDVLGGHEDEIREIADRVQQAVDAAGTAQALDFDAFGLVGQVFAIPIQVWLTTADGFLNAAVEAGHDVADRVKKAHTAFREHEEKTKCLLEGIGKELPA